MPYPTTAEYAWSLEFAKAADAADPLFQKRQQFHIPRFADDDVVYLCGNSLGLQPKSTRAAINQVLQQWSDLGVEGHHRGELPWMPYHRFLTPAMAQVVGAKEHEVVVTNSLTANLHLLMVSFYQPTADRYAILMEAGAFPSDQYAVESQVRYHGLDPEQAIIEVSPREGENHVRTEDLLAAIQEHGARIALVLFSGVQYYTGQYFDLEAITKAGHAAGAKVGFDLAHAVGNLPLRLHDWGPDFACWCSYKYLNAGPGGPGGLFVHERWADTPELPRFAGWWGYEESTRFKMQKGFKPMRGAEAWQLSNAPVLGMAAFKASLEVFHETGMELLREKSISLTGYLEWGIHQLREKGMDITILTPADPQQRGCQLSLWVPTYKKRLFEHLQQEGIICDWREPDVIRLSPVPLYNNYFDVWQTLEVLRTFAP